MLNKQRARYVIRDTMSGFYVAIDSCRHMFTLVYDKQAAYKFSSENNAHRVIADELFNDTVRYRIEPA